MNEKLFKKIRILKKISQKEVCTKLNISQATLSRYENNYHLINVIQTEALLNVYDLNFEDFIRLKNENSEFQKNKISLLKNLKKPNHEEINHLYNFFNKNKKKSNILFSHYLKIKLFFHIGFPNIVPDFTFKEIEDIYQKLHKNKLHSHEDYHMLGIISHKMEINNFEQLVKEMIPEKKIIYEIENIYFINLCMILLNNLIDRLIEVRDLKRLAIYFPLFKKLAEENFQTSFQLLIPYYELIIDSKFEMNNYHYNKMENLLHAIEEIKMENLSKSMRKEYLSIINSTNIDINDKLFYTD